MLIQILGVKIDDVSLEEAGKIIGGWLSVVGQSVDGKPKTTVLSGKTADCPKIVVTPGPEFLVEAQRDLGFKKALNGADLAVPDGAGLQIFAGIKNRVPGVELTLRLCKLAAEKGWTIGLFGGWEGEGAKAKAELEKRFPGIKIAWTIDGGKADIIWLSVVDPSALKTDRPETDNWTPVDLLFVALGIKKQEFFMDGLKANNLKLKARVAVGVGSTLDYLSGALPRAPQWLRSLGLEWLFRLLCATKSRRRIITAVVEFPLRVFVGSLS